MSLLSKKLRDKIAERLTELDIPMCPQTALMGIKFIKFRDECILFVKDTEQGQDIFLVKLPNNHPLHGLLSNSTTATQ